jgi:hypothetical protein
MTYDDFSDKLRKAKLDFRRLYGRDMETVEELEKFLDRMLARRTKVSKAARSLKGIFQ